MNELTPRGPGPEPVTALRTPFQTPAVDRNPAARQGYGGDNSGVEADFGFLPLLSLAGKAIGALAG
ncbi:hypothetical protein OG895_13175 [Streptomyces sp. NBC_00201]|uniref:hypothetical protein n=1 Tax=unclassified Streptomyces TaxID=2593676 RepID=UPI0022520373|nr:MULTISPECIES: hypothetical protein [unclassified Streptomyces]MCX5246179.1 hypothetical protein [Streptomyces sp. NBC_00201]